MEDVSVLREECTLKFEGPAIRNHEMDITALANGLLAFQHTIEQANSALNGKRTLISVKIKGGFTEGSLETNIIVEYIGAFVPVVPDVINCVKELITFKKFLNGEPPKEVRPADEGGLVQISNNQGSQITINQVVVNLNNSGPVNTALGKLFDPLGDGVDSIGISTSNEAGIPTSFVAVETEEKSMLTPAVEDQIEEQVSERELEILASQNDGKALGWRFYDLEDDVEFTASIGDEHFLSDVMEKRYSFQNGDRIRAKLSETKRFVNQRKRTNRVILKVLSYNRPEAA